MAFRFTPHVSRGLVAVFLLAVVCVAGAAAQPPQDSGSGRKTAQAVRVPAGAIDVDGRVGEEAWRAVPPITDFVQKEPVEGAPPTDRMEVRIAYDDDALYVGARMWSTALIQAPMGRRDSGDQAEHLVVSFDTYLDRRTSSSFGVTAVGVRLDRYYPRDANWPNDPRFDPVWQARTAIDEDGWSAELWIPFSQLRFTNRDPQVWGFNIQRWVPSRNEEVYWALIPRTEQRRTSLFGELHGIGGIRPSRRIELLPYVASSSQVLAERDRANPFTGGANLEGRVGLDGKIGIGSNLTLDLTVNPDFGQVEADPAEVNLTAFETFFNERRPFFMEGTNLLTGSVNNYFYSRRIGARPAVRASGDFVDYPASTTILGAGKLTGRTASGLSVGMLGAVTDDESARTFSTGGAIRRTRVAPRTTFGVTRLQQEFGRAGSSTAVMATALHRDFEAGDPLAALLTRKAFTLNSDSLFRLKSGEYDVQLNAGVSYIDGESTAMTRVQRSSARYLHRPDATHLSYDPARTSMAGTKVVASVERRRGRHWLWQAGTELSSPEFETNDIGRLNTTDYMRLEGELEYRDTEPNRWRRNYSLSLETTGEWNYGGELQELEIGPNLRLTWPNFWQLRAQSGFRTRAQNARLTRGGPLMEQPSGWDVELDLESSDASETRGNVGVGYGRTEDGGLRFEIDSSFEVQPGPRWQISVSPEYEREIDTQQYITAIAGGGLATYSSRYVFAHIDRATYSTEIRWNFTFKPDLTLDLYGEPFAASGRYGDVGELVAARTREIRRYGTDGTTLTTLPDGTHRVTDGPATFGLRHRDFNVLSFRSNLVLRWEWRPGSTLYLVWQQDRSAEIFTPDRVSLNDLFESVGRRGDNFFAIKASFWLSP